MLLQVELVAGVNAGNWLVHNGQWVLVPSGRKETVSGDARYWECRFRREKTTRCPYKLTTVEEKDELEPKIKYPMKTCMPTCRQDQTHVIDLKFRNKIKELASNNFKFDYGQTFGKEKKNLLKSITDIDLRERVRMILPTQEEFRSAAYRAKKKGIPVAPRRLEDLDFSLLNTDSRNMENYILSRDPESKIVLFGTEKTVQTFIAAKFKTMDGTFKIAPSSHLPGPCENKLCPLLLCAAD